MKSAGCTKMKNRLTGAAVAVLVLTLTGCKEKEGVTFVKDPDNKAEKVVPPGWATVARSEIESGLSMSVFSAQCKLLYREANWFVGCKPVKSEAPFMLYSIRENEALRESFAATAVNQQAKKYTHQNVLLRQIAQPKENDYAALNVDSLQQAYDALAGA